MKILRNSRNSNVIILADGLVDGREPMLQPNATIVVHRGRIREIKVNVAADRFEVQEGYELVRLPGLTVLPAFIDCHVHLALDGVDFAAALNRWEREDEWLAQVKVALQDYLHSGLALIRDGGDKGNIGLKTKKLVDKGQLDGPQLLACGQAIGKKGRYGSFLGPGIASLEEAYSLLESLKQAGADWVKILVSGIVSFKEYGAVGATQFSDDELNSMVDYAHNLGLPVMAHASSNKAVVQAVKAGVDSVEHGYFVSNESLALMAAKGIPWVPTVVPVANQVKPPSQHNHSSESQEIIKRTYELQVRKLAEAFNLGVPLGIGTDAGAAGVLHASDFFTELELFAQAGLPAGEIIKAATSNGARICGLEEELGTIEVGKRACLIGVRGNPLADLSSLKQVEFMLI